MKVINYKKFQSFPYESVEGPFTEFELGDVVIDPQGDVAVVIQNYNDDWGEVRTDVNGNVYEEDCRLATLEEVKNIRPELLNQLVIVDESGEGMYHYDTDLNSWHPIERYTRFDTKAKHVETVELNTGESLEVFRHENNGIFAVDSSYLEQNFEDDKDIIVLDPFNKGELVLLLNI